MIRLVMGCLDCLFFTLAKRITRLRSKVFLSSSLLVMMAIFPISSSFASDYASPPSDIDAFHGKINNSLVDVKCGNLHSIGFAGNFLLTEVQKNQGINSLVVSTATTTEGCRYVDNNNLGITYKDTNYSAGTQFWSGKFPDLATFTTTVNIPTLPLFGSNLPKPGDWVGIVESVPGFGFRWTYSKIEIVNSQTLLVAFDAVNPPVTDRALAFDNQGIFIGMISSFGSTAPSGMAIIQGAPLQCQRSKTQTSPTITNCGTTSDQIWVTKPPVQPIENQTKNINLLVTMPTTVHVGRVSSIDLSGTANSATVIPNVIISSLSRNICTTNGLLVYGVSPGSCLVQIEAKPNSNIVFTAKTYQVDVTKIAQEVYYSDDGANITLTQKTLELNPNSDSGGEIIATSLTSSICTMNGLMVSLRKVGICSIKLVASETDSYLESQEFEISFNIVAPKTLVCIKGQLTKKVTALNPVCPKGFKKK